MDPTEFFVPDLHHAVVRIQRYPKTNPHADNLVLMTPSYEDNGVFVPAESVTLHNRHDILQLRDTLLAVYPVGGEHEQAVPKKA